MSALLRFVRSATAGQVVLAVSGEVDMSSAHLLDTQLSLAQRCAGVVRAEPGYRAPERCRAPAERTVAVREPAVSVRAAPELSDHDPQAAVVLDLTGVRFLSAVGVDVIANAAFRARETQVPLIVVAPVDGPAHRTIMLAGLENAIPSHPTVDAALRSVGQSP